jgi:mRNA interferase RelE/StbE
MIYELFFSEGALKEWKKLDPSIQMQFKKKLILVRENPYISKNKLSNFKDCYKIKLRSSGYRLVYKIINDRLVIQIVAIGKREGNLVYFMAESRA